MQELHPVRLEKLEGMFCVNERDRLGWSVRNVFFILLTKFVSQSICMVFKGAKCLILLVSLLNLRKALASIFCIIG